MTMDIVYNNGSKPLEYFEGLAELAIVNQNLTLFEFNAAGIIQALVNKIKELDNKNNRLYRELNRRTTGNEQIMEDGSVTEEGEDIDAHEFYGDGNN